MFASIGVFKVVQLVVLITSQLEGANQLSAQANPQQSSLIPLLITYLRKLDADLLHFAFLEVKKLTAPSAEYELIIKYLKLENTYLMRISNIIKCQKDRYTSLKITLQKACFCFSSVISIFFSSISA